MKTTMSDDTALTRQYLLMTRIVRQYSEWRPASLKIVLVDRVDWRLGAFGGLSAGSFPLTRLEIEPNWILGKRILHGD